MRQYLKDVGVLGWLTALLLGIGVLFYTLAHAQQPSPADQLAQAQAMVSTLYRQLNTAIQDGAQQEAAKLKAQQEVERLKAQVAEWQKKGKEPSATKESD